MTKALSTFHQVNEYSWHTPGHTGGTAFLKHPAGRAFYDFYGENLFRTDLSISVGALGGCAPAARRWGDNPSARQLSKANIGASSGLR